MTNINIEGMLKALDAIQCVRSAEPDNYDHSEGYYAIINLLNDMGYTVGENYGKHTIIK